MEAPEDLMLSSPANKYSTRGGYLPAVVAATAAIVLRWLFGPILEEDYPFILGLIAGCLVCKWYGFGPGLWTMILAMVGTFCLMFPASAPLLVKDLLGFLITFGGGVLIAWLIEAHRLALATSEELLRAEKRLAQEKDQAEQRVVRLDQLHTKMAREAEEREQLLTTMRESAQEILDLYNLAPCGYHTVDMSGRIVAMNDTELSWLGYRRDELVGRKQFLELVGPDHVQNFRQSWQHFLLQGELTNLELDLLRKNGSRMPVLLTAVTVKDQRGKVVASRAAVVDLTDARRKEETIQLFARLVENVPLGVIVWQQLAESAVPDLYLVSANPAASHLLNVDLQARLGKSAREIFPTIAEDLLTQFHSVIDSGACRDMGYVLYGDDRIQQSWWATRGVPLSQRRVAILFENVTEKRQAAETIRHLNESLEMRVEDRTRELAETNRLLLEKNQENELFVYSVSHDLRSPLVNLQGFSRELALTCAELNEILAGANLDDNTRSRTQLLLGRDMKESIHYIVTAVLRLGHIIDALLRLSRAGRVDYQMEQVDVAAVVAWVVESMKATILERGATVTIGELPTVCGDSTAIEQLFANLIGNALKYLDPARPGLIEVTCEPEADGAWLTYRVSDNGLGIAERFHGKIFQAFQRVHPDVAPGEGMGLAIVRRIVDRHRGKVWVESREGRGSTFFVSLPLRQAPRVTVGSGSNGEHSLKFESCI